jgi:hypothetical protein
MAFNLNDFRNQFVNGGARPSQFEMQIIWPDAVRGAAGVAAAETSFRFLCSISEIPGQKITAIPVPYFGRKLKYAGDLSFSPLTVTVFNDEDFKIHKAIEIWMKAIQDHPTTRSVFDGGITASSYVTDGFVTQMSRNLGGSPTQAYAFRGMWPTDLSAIALNWTSSDTVEEFQIQFEYQWWDQVDPTTGTVTA